MSCPCCTGPVQSLSREVHYAADEIEGRTVGTGSPVMKRLHKAPNLAQNSNGEGNSLGYVMQAAASVSGT